MDRETLRDNRTFILNELRGLYFDVRERLDKHHTDISNIKTHVEIYNDIWVALTETTNIKMFDIYIMIGLLDAINMSLIQLSMLNDCCYPEFVERLKQIKLLLL